MGHETQTDPDQSPLSPLRTRLIVFAVLAVIALGSIWLIDRRAIERMHDAAGPSPASSVQSP